MELTIAFCGDIMLGAEVAGYMAGKTVTEWLSDISEVWRGADLVIGNLECPCVTNAQPIESSTPELVFHAPAFRIKQLRHAGFSAVTLANNHIMNCGRQGLLETLQRLDQAGIHHCGAGMTLREASRPAFIAVGGATVALVAFTYDITPAGRSRAGVATYTPKLMCQALAEARAGADLVIAALHDGLEYSDVPPSRVRARFRFLAQNGADIVIGHHPHVLQGLEWYQEVPVAYSLGDFLFHNTLPHVAKRNFSRIAMGQLAPEEIRRDPDKFNRGAVLTVSVSNGRKSVQWHPFRQDAKCCPRLSEGNIRKEDLSRLAELSVALLSTSDFRHRQADAVFEAARMESLDQVGIKQVLKLALRPKWRYLPRGLHWLARKIGKAYIFRLRRNSRYRTE